MDCNTGVQTSSGFVMNSNYSVWNRDNLNEQVLASIVFRFGQQVKISRISTFFWSAPIDGVGIPNLILYWSNNDSVTPSNNISFRTTQLNISNERQRKRLNTSITDQGLMFQYLRISMTFVEGIKIFLSEVLFCGKFIYICHGENQYR